MTRRFLVTIVLAVVVLAVQAQENKYIVKTRQEKKENADSKARTDSTQQESTQDFLAKYFPYVSVCDWEAGMRFMVMPERRDLIVKTFTDSLTGKMVSNTQLRQKIMVYKGHGKPTHELHERIYFTCEDDGKTYYYEIPVLKYDDFCAGKAGVPALAYLGDVDAAIAELTDTTLFTLAGEYYVDMDGGGYKAINVAEGTEVRVVSVGVGTRSFPVKIVVADKDGNEFYQNVAISRTNSGLRDEDFEENDVKIHLFSSAFELPSDNLAASKTYQNYIGSEVYTKYPSTFKDANDRPVKVARLSTFCITDIRAHHANHSVTLTLRGLGTGKTYTKDVVFTDWSGKGGSEGPKVDLYTSLFGDGNPINMPGVKNAHLAEIQKGIVRQGFSEAEVLLAIGNPSSRGEDGAFYTWIYQYPDRPYVCVFFDIQTRMVRSVKKL